MGFLTKNIIRFPWQSTINLAIEVAAQIEAWAAIGGLKMADALRQVAKEGIKVLIGRLDSDDKKRFDGLYKTIMEQKELRKAIERDTKKAK